MKQGDIRLGILKRGVWWKADDAIIPSCCLLLLFDGAVAFCILS